MKNLDGIKMKLMMQEGKIRLEKIKNRRIKFRWIWNECIRNKNKCWDRNIKKWRKEDKKYNRLF